MKKLGFLIGLTIILSGCSSQIAKDNLVVMDENVEDIINGGSKHSLMNIITLKDSKDVIEKDLVKYINDNTDKIAKESNWDEYDRATTAVFSSDEIAIGQYEVYRVKDDDAIYEYEFEFDDEFDCTTIYGKLKK